MSRVLLDTSAYSALFRGHSGILAAVESAEVVCLNPVVVGELCAGFARGGRGVHNHHQLRKFIASGGVEIRDITEETAHRYTLILTSLWSAGTPLPTNDIWIAASAMEHGLRLLTTDRHFKQVRQVLVNCFDPE